MDATSLLEYSTDALMFSFINTLDDPFYSNITDELVGLAKANVTKHVTNLLYTPNNESVAEMINCVSEGIGYSRKNTDSEKKRIRS